MNPKEAPRSEETPETGGALFCCEGLCKGYGNGPVIAGAGLSLPSGAFVSIAGPSGAGKTTLFNALAGLDAPDGGRVFLRGRDITGIPGHIAYMPQKDLLLEHLTVMDNVTLPLLLRGTKKEEARRRAAPLWGLFGLDGFQCAYPAVLSGGMRRRAALLRACLWDAPVILLDEPFSALDAVSRLRLRVWYEEVARHLRLSTLCVTHDIEEAVHLSDTVYILSGKPARLSAPVPIPAKRPRNEDFLLSPECAALKRKLLAQLRDAFDHPPS